MVRAECPDGDVWTYAYDPFGRRISKVCKHTKVTFIWDGDVIAREITETAARVDVVDWFFEPGSFRPMARLEARDLTLVINDHLGTPKEVVGGDGSLRWSADHDTWGTLRTKRGAASAQVETGDYWVEPTSIEGNTAKAYAHDPDGLYCPIRFQGQWEDGETGLYYNRFRYYDNFADQYVSSDPIGLLGGFRPQSYVYATSNAVDPSGLARTGEAGVVNGVLCIVNIFSPGGRSPDVFRASEFDGFMELWDENARATPGGLTRRSVSASERTRANTNNARIRRCCASLFREGDVVGHLPDMGWGGTAVPSSDGWVPLNTDVNGFIGRATGRVPVGTTYNSVRSVASMDDC